MNVTTRARVDFLAVGLLVVATIVISATRGWKTCVREARILVRVKRGWWACF